MIDDQYDNNNKKGYLITLYTKNGNQIPGSNSEISHYPIIHGGDYGMKGDEDAALIATKAELEANPELKSDWEVPYL